MYCFLSYYIAPNCPKKDQEEIEEEILQIMNVYDYAEIHPRAFVIILDESDDWSFIRGQILEIAQDNNPYLLYFLTPELEQKNLSTFTQSKTIKFIERHVLK